MSDMVKVYKNERPKWCPHAEACNFQKQAVSLLCCGELPEPIEHDGDFNTHRFCINNTEDNFGVFDLQINKSDVWWFFYTLQPANDIKETLRQETLRKAAAYFDLKHKEKPYQSWHTDVVARHIRGMIRSE
ncbi:MAG: hypothetical protein FVQ79_04285 [Planctomycetes bacterium]|nr:hypothetical protein [Planctomycetota bacterium]